MEVIVISGPGSKKVVVKDKEIFVFETAEQVSDFSVEVWKELADGAIKGKGIFTVALSGGKTPLKFYHKLNILNRAYWNKTHIFLVDERYVPFISKESNFRSIKESLLDRVEIPNENVHFISTQEGDPAISAIKYEENLKSFFRLQEDEFPRFDLILLGIGEDGHTASLFPGTTALDEKKRMVVDVKSRKLKNKRISLTLPVINSAKNVVFLVTGKNKAEVVREVICKVNNKLPAALVNHPAGKISFFLDKDVAWLISADLFKPEQEEQRRKIILPE